MKERDIYKNGKNKILHGFIDYCAALLQHNEQSS